jgi:hypothetical protein
MLARVPLSGSTASGLNLARYIRAIKSNRQRRDRYMASLHMIHQEREASQPQRGDLSP